MVITGRQDPDDSHDVDKHQSIETIDNIPTSSSDKPTENNTYNASNGDDEEYRQGLFLPLEIISHIVNMTADWELATSLGVPHSLRKTAPWREQATEMDHAILTGNVSVVRATDHRIASRRQRNSSATLNSSSSSINNNNNNNNIILTNNASSSQINTNTNLSSSPSSSSSPQLPTSSLLHHSRNASTTSSSSPRSTDISTLIDFATPPTFSEWGCRVMIRFGFINLLEYFRLNHPRHLNHQCRYLLPSVASAWGRIQVLEWARKNNFPMGINSDAMDEASRHGHVHILQWWLSSPGLPPPVYSENALASATIKGQIAVLEWWKASKLSLKIGNVLDFASMMEDTGGGESTIMLDWWTQSGLPCKYTNRALYYLSSRGHVKLLDWWLNSGHPLYYDRQVLTGATRRGQVASLDWWLQSKLLVTYSFFDIDEALEDAFYNVEQTRNWWAKRGFDPAMSDDEWMRERELC